MDSINPMTEKDDLKKDQIIPEKKEQTTAPEQETTELPIKETTEQIEEVEAKPESEAKTPTEPASEPAAKAEPETKVEAEVKAESESKAESEVKTEAETKVESEVKVEAEPETESQPETAETITEPESEISVEKAVEEDDDDILVDTSDEDDEDDEDDDEINEELEISVKISEMSKQELCDHLKELLESEDIVAIKSEVEEVKQSFYKKSKVETDQQRVEFIEQGGDELDFIPVPTLLEDDFKELLDEYRNRRAKYTAKLKKQKENNLLKKNHIIEQIKQLIDSKEDVTANISVFRQLQQDWKETGPVPAPAVRDLWRRYNRHQEAFWDLIKINNELREYDFRKNLEAKNKLIETAEALDAEPDVVSAFRQLQKLHEEWREIGPVARNLREETWARFKAASTVINKKHQSHFDEIRAMEEKNLERKIALCERLEAVDTSDLSGHKEWNEATKKILDMQEEWRQIGFAPRKSNRKVYERYRKACDVFFDAKADFYKELKAKQHENLEKKKALCEKAEAMKDSTDWKESTEFFIQIQKEWKTIGPTPRKSSDEVWKRFITACDYFFEQRNKNRSGRQAEEQQNLVKKKDLIERIKAFEKSENPNDSLAALRALAAEWHSIGFVPYKEKDKIYKEYRAALDAQFDDLNISASQRRLESFKSNLKDMTQKGENKLFREREKLVRAYENLKNEIATYENNMGFLSISSKKGGGMLQEMERKIEALKEECRLLEQKINMIDENI